MEKEKDLTRAKKGGMDKYKKKGAIVTLEKKLFLWNFFARRFCLLCHFISFDLSVIKLKLKLHIS